MSRFIALGLVASVLAVPTQLHTRKGDEITSLPGLTTPLNFKQYSGYLDLPQSQKHIFYWFTESQRDPANDPIVFWTNGGPGCSGLIGFMTEHGPFRPDATGKLTINPYSWNRIANMVYIEQPAGVGFSYSDNTDDYTVGDPQAAHDSFQLILQFLQRYPEYNNNDVYITSESYGGHYMPNLALYIAQHNQGQFNFKGFAVGNPLTNFVENGVGMFGGMFGHQVVALPTFREWYDNCSNNTQSSYCDSIRDRLTREQGNLNPYAIDYPVCNNQLLAAGRPQRTWLARYLARGHKIVRLQPDASYEPCESDFATTYLNRDDVQTALHTSPTEWAPCSNIVNYNQTDVNRDMIPVYKDLLQNHPEVKILVFSGADDTVCGAMGTQQWIWGLGLHEKSHWVPWAYEDTRYGSQTGGYLTKFSGLSFATVSGAGHEVPAYKPAAAFVLFSHFLDGSVF